MSEKKIYTIILPYCEKCGRELKGRSEGIEATPYWQCAEKCVKYTKKKELVTDMIECLERWIEERK